MIRSSSSFLPNWQTCLMAIAISATALATDMTRVLAQPRIDVLDGGTLERVFSNPRLMETVVPALVRIETEEPITINITSPSLVNGPNADPRGTQRRVLVRQNGRRVGDSADAHLLDISPGTTDLEVSMQVERPRDFLPGYYTYQFNLVVTD